MSNTERISSELIPVVILILSVLIFFSKIIFSGSPLFGSDFVLQFHPWKGFIYDSVRSHGALPGLPASGREPPSPRASEVGARAEEPPAPPAVGGHVRVA